MYLVINIKAILGKEVQLRRAVLAGILIET